MNRIRVGRLIASGLITFFVFIAVEYLLERVVGNYLFGGGIERWMYSLAIPNWSVTNNVLNILIALVNVTVVMWLYAALRPMFGVGARTALITSGFMLVFVSSFTFNQVNLGIYPLQVAIVQLVYQYIELPIAAIVGARYYEGG
jgi:hypothetical protein